VQTLLRDLGGALVPWGYVILAAATALEAAAFLGLFVPGETVLIVAGVLASRGRLNLPLVIALAALGAVIGDSIGYEIGRHGGDRIKRSRLGRAVGEERWQRARDFVHRHGALSVLLGRWIGVLRALVPAVVGDARMPYPRFLLWNAVGAMVWAPAVVMAGYLAGSSALRVEHALGRWTYVVLGLAAAVGIVVWLVRRHRSHAEGGSPASNSARRDQHV
jgi:membrane-associated protein